MDAKEQVANKILEIKNELKELGVWKQTMPVWVGDFGQATTSSERDFMDWLQFVYLPNCLHQSVTTGRQYIVPQAIKFFNEDLKKGKLLQLLIELDGLV